MKHMAANSSQYLRRPVSALLRLMMASAVVFAFLNSASAQTAVTPSGSGTAEDPYQITVLGNLVWMGNTVGSSSGKYYKLMNDIDASETATWDGGKGFVPIGSDGTPFKGTFDGNNRKITSLTINRPDRHYVGLFGRAQISSTIKNLGLEDFTILGDQNCGGLAGGVSTLGSPTLFVTNCYSSGSVSGTSNCGGLVGVAWGSISDCYSTAGVSGTSCCGGLVGFQGGGSISNCYSSGSVSSGTYHCGGLLGYQRAGSISNCYSSGSVTADSYSGGLLGYQEAGSISNCYSSGSVTVNSYSGGLLGFQQSGSVSDCYYDKETSGQSDNTGKGTPKTTAEMKQQATFSGWDFATVWSINEGVDYPKLRSVGSLKVTISPEGAVTAGAQWSINGGVTWHDSGATVTGLPVADYTVTYKTIPAWDAPAPVSVTVTKGATTSITGTYALKTFTITSNCGPNGTISPKGVFSVNYGSSKTYTITPNDFYSVREVRVDGVNVGPVTSYTFTNVTSDHTIVATFHAPLDIVLLGGDFTAGTDTSLAPGAAVDLSWTVNASRAVGDPVWFEVFGSRTGGFDQVRTGAAMTSSYKKQDGLGAASSTVKPGTLKLNPVCDGVYTLVPSVNRGNLPGAVGETDYTNNWLPIAGKRLSVHNPNLSDIDLVVSDVGVQYDPAFPTKITFTGKIWNAGSENLVKPGCWVEVFYGTLTAEEALMPQGTIGAGVKIETLAAGSSAAFTLSGTVPAGVQNRALAVVADSTDIVPEIDETNNVYLAYDPSVLPAGKTNGVDLVITDMTVDESQLAPHSVAPGEKLNFTVTVWNRGTVTPSQKVYLEMFASQDGGLSNVAGVTVTWSEQITAPALGETKTYTLSKTLNSIGDGMYTLVATVNRTALAANPGDQTPLDNRFKYAAGRIFLKTPPVSGTANIVWTEGPTFTQNGTQMTVAGTIKNTGTAATRAFWTEAFIGTMQAKTGVFYKDTNLVFCAGDNCPGLAAGATKQITLTGTVPSGKVVGVLADSTDVVAETDETDNYDYSGLTN